MRYAKTLGLGLIVVGILVSEGLLLADAMTRPIAIATTILVLVGIVLLVIASRAS